MRNCHPTKLRVFWWSVYFYWFLSLQVSTVFLSLVLNKWWNVYRTLFIGRIIVTRSFKNRHLSTSKLLVLNLFIWSVRRSWGILINFSQSKEVWPWWNRLLFQLLNWHTFEQRCLKLVSYWSLYAFLAKKLWRLYSMSSFGFLQLLDSFYLVLFFYLQFDIPVNSLKAICLHDVFYLHNWSASIANLF